KMPLGIPVEFSANPTRFQSACPPALNRAVQTYLREFRLIQDAWSGSPSGSKVQNFRLPDDVAPDRNGRATVPKDVVVQVQMWSPGSASVTIVPLSARGARLISDQVTFPPVPGPEPYRELGLLPSYVARMPSIKVTPFDEALSHLTQPVGSDLAVQEDAWKTVVDGLAAADQTDPFDGYTDRLLDELARTSGRSVVARTPDILWRTGPAAFMVAPGQRMKPGFGSPGMILSLFESPEQSVEDTKDRILALRCRPEITGDLLMNADRGPLVSTARKIRSSGGVDLDALVGAAKSLGPGAVALGSLLRVPWLGLQQASIDPVTILASQGPSALEDARRTATGIPIDFEALPRQTQLNLLYVIGNMGTDSFDEEPALVGKREGLQGRFLADAIAREDAPIELRVRMSQTTAWFMDLGGGGLIQPLQRRVAGLFGPRDLSGMRPPSPAGPAQMREDRRRFARLPVALFTYQLQSGQVDVVSHFAIPLRRFKETWVKWDQLPKADPDREPKPPRP
ncbi:MAG: hypothetical protein MH204_12695, partial [Fimbriimonadaceae bacterium]|nr:hypothetical protein [Fimbriimonadaceae bacterium]